MMNGVEHYVTTQAVLELEQPAMRTATATQQLTSVHAARAGQEEGVRFPTAKEILTALTVDIVILHMILQFVRAVYKDGWVQDVEIPVYMDNRFQWTVETVFVKLDGLASAAIASVLNMEMS